MHFRLQNTTIFSSTFGSVKTQRAWVDESRDYRFGFNGQEKDNEVAGEGNSYTAEFWQYDARLVRRWNIDPKPNPSISVYAAFANNPIFFVDRYGDSVLASNNMVEIVSEANDLASGLAESNNFLNTGTPFNSVELQEKYQISFNYYLESNKEKFESILNNQLKLLGEDAENINVLNEVVMSIMKNIVFEENWNTILVDDSPDNNRPDPKQGIIKLTSMAGFSRAVDNAGQSVISDYHKARSNDPPNAGDPNTTQFHFGVLEDSKGTKLSIKYNIGDKSITTIIDYFHFDIYYAQ